MYPLDLQDKITKIEKNIEDLAESLREISLILFIQNIENLNKHSSFLRETRNYLDYYRFYKKLELINEKDEQRPME